MKVNFCAQTKQTATTVPNELAVRNLYKNFISINKPIYDKDVYIKDFSTLNFALNKLSEVSFSKDDIKKIKRYGAKPIFKNGKEALKFAKDNNILITFEKVSSPDIHAQWINIENKIIINDRYKNTRNLAEIYAISAAIIHELAHAKDKDDISSIQEEINCLAMNALAFNAFRNENPDLFKGQNSPIIEDGVELYSNLFLGDNKEALIQRIKLKYGDLATTSENHPASDFVQKEFSNLVPKPQQKTTKGDF